MPLHIVGYANNQIWTTTRISASSGFTPWENVSVRAAAPAFPSHAEIVGVGCAIVNTPLRHSGGLDAARLHICATWRQGQRVGLAHTIQFGSGAYQPWLDAGAIAFPNAPLSGAVDCAGIADRLHVCVAASLRRNNTTQIVRSIRAPSGAWSPLRAVSTRTDDAIISNVGCAAVPTSTGTNLHVISRVLTLAGDTLLIHNIWYPSGASQPQQDQNMIASASLPGAILHMRASGINNTLAIVGSDTAKSSLIDGNWNTATWTAVSDLGLHVDPKFTGDLTHPACAYVGDDLHFCALSSGRIVHAIRLASGLFRNPETSGASAFDDVIAAVPVGADGAPTPRFDNVACAGTTRY